MDGERVNSGPIRRLLGATVSSFRRLVGALGSQAKEDGGEVNCTLETSSYLPDPVGPWSKGWSVGRVVVDVDRDLGRNGTDRVFSLVVSQ